MTFVFLHVGPELKWAALLVRSIRKHVPAAEIIQCTDARTAEVAGVTRTYRQPGDTANLMAFRLSCFGALALDAPAAYLDTDMLMVRAIDPARVLGDRDVAVCERTFGKEDLINPAFKGMDLSEYTNRTFGEIYPYLACFTVARDGGFWRRCRDELERLPKKFRYWYGDQEAIRNVVNSGAYRVRTISERVYGCLPEFRGKSADAPRMLHFKGPARKEPMVAFARALGLEES